VSGAWGASPGDWQHFADRLDLTRDLLPVVSNPTATISAKSKMKGLGKTPSRYNPAREVVGVPNWTSRESTERDIKMWQRDSDLGICIQTRLVRAIDVDIADPVEAARAAQFIEIGLGIELPKRMRANSGKFLLAFRLAGDYCKSVIHTSHGDIEFLANGQQFIAVGAHVDAKGGYSGFRYEWEGGLPAEIPVLTPAEFDALWGALGAAFGISGAAFESRGVKPSIPRSSLDMHGDPKVAFLQANGWVKEFDRSGIVHIRCPWEDEHTSDSGPSATSYFPAGVGGINAGHYKCLHSHCIGRGDSAFDAAVGWTESEFEVVEAAGGDLQVEEWPALERDKQGRIEPTLLNTLAMLERADVVGVRLAYDDFKACEMVAYGNAGEWRALRDTDYTEVRRMLALRGMKNPGREMVRDAVLKVCEQNTIDTAVQWARSLRWDGVPRVASFFTRFMSVPDTPYIRAVARYMWSALAGRCVEPGVKADMVPVFVSKQGKGKTSMVEVLAPSEDAFLEVNLEVRDDNLARQLRGKLVGEWAELRGLRTKDSEAIKAWVTRRHEEWVPKFKEFAIRFPRRMVMIGTANEDEILDDPTGERRWLPMQVGVVDVAGIREARDQLWAEAVALFDQHGVMWQEAQALAVDEHEHFKVSDSWADSIRAWLGSDQMDGPDGPKRGDAPFTLAQVALGALGLDLRNIAKKDEWRIGKILRAQGYANKVRGSGANRGKRWVRAENSERAGNGTLDDIA